MNMAFPGSGVAFMAGIILSPLRLLERPVAGRSRACSTPWPKTLAVQKIAECPKRNSLLPLQLFMWAQFVWASLLALPAIMDIAY